MATILERNKKIKAPKKTRQEHDEDALYREVWEEVNNEKTLRFVKKYYKYILGAVVVILLIASGIQIGLRAHYANRVATANAYEAAIESVDANALAQLSNNTSDPMGDLALFQAYLLDKDIAKLERLASDGASRDFRDLAKLHIVSLRGDKMTADEVEKYLSDLDTKKSPFYYTACLTIAQKFLSVGETGRADKWLDKILSDENAPAAISATAQTLR